MRTDNTVLFPLKILALYLVFTFWTSTFPPLSSDIPSSIVSATMGLLTPTANKSVTKVHSSKLLTTRSNISFNFNYLTLFFQPVSVYLLSTSNYWNIITCTHIFAQKKKEINFFFCWVPAVTDLGWHWCRGAPSQRPRGQPAATVQTTAAASPSLVPSTETNTQPLYSSLQCPRLFISEIHMRVGM